MLSTMPRRHRKGLILFSFSLSFSELEEKPSQVLCKLSSEFYSTLKWNLLSFCPCIAMPLRLLPGFHAFFQDEQGLISSHKELQRKNSLIKTRGIQQKTLAFLFYKSHCLTKEIETLLLLAPRRGRQRKSVHNPAWHILALPLPRPHAFWCYVEVIRAGVKWQLPGF